MNKIRTMLYHAARILGDINAVKQGKVGKRLLRRAVGRGTGKLFGKIFK